MHIDRCVCYDVHFDRLKSIAARTDADSVETLQEHVSFGHDCSRCHPYVKRMLRSGETVFSEIIGENDGNDRSSSKLEQ